MFFSEDKKRDLNVPLSEGVFDGIPEGCHHALPQTLEESVVRVIYPKSRDILYPPDNFFYDYVSSYLIQSHFLLMDDMKYAAVVHRYTNAKSYPQDADEEDLLDFNDLVSAWDDIVSHGSVWDFTKFPDDFALIGESEYHYWMLYYDQDVSDCSIARASKDACDLGEFLEYIKGKLESQGCRFEIKKLDFKKQFVRV